MTTGDTTSDVREVPVRFESDGAELVGEIYLPTDYEPDTPLPGVVVTGTWTSVRQQMTQRYAKKLATEGLVALSFDYRSYGESGGEPREIESPEAKVRDITNATEFLTARDEVDGERVGGIAICASVMYMAQAIAQGAPLKAFATSAAWIHDPETVGMMYGGDEGLEGRIDAGCWVWSERTSGDYRLSPAFRDSCTISDREAYRSFTNNTLPALQDLLTSYGQQIMLNKEDRTSFTPI